MVRVWLPPDANTTLSITDHCLRSTDHVNLIVVDKQKHLQYLTLEQAHRHCADGAGIWDWASTCGPDETPDVVLACAGDVPTQEALAAVELLHQYVPELKVRFVNVVDLMALLPENDHPQGTTTTPFDMVVLNRMSRFHLAKEALRRAHSRVTGWEDLAQLCDHRLAGHERYIRENLADLPDVASWTWQGLDR